MSIHLRDKHLIIGIGSPFGNDRAGWQVVQLLSGLPLPPYVKLLCLDRPGPELIAQMQGQDRITLIDAILSQEHPPGSCLELNLDQLAHANSNSSHGFGLAQTLALAQALGQLPARLRLFGITTSDISEREGTTEDVTTAAKALAQRLACEYQTAIGSGGVGSLGSSSSSSS